MKKRINKKTQNAMLKVEEFKSNPLIAALNPPPMNEDEAIARLLVLPAFDPSERSLPAYVRTSLPGRLRRFFNPTPQHAKIAQYVASQIHDGYRIRNPFTAQGQRRLHDGGIADPDVNRTSSVSFITGLSGMGKSVLIRTILSTLGGPVIRHEGDKDRPFTETQVVYLMRNVPDQCSVKSVFKAFIGEIDRLLGRDLYSSKYMGRGNTRTDYVAELSRVMANHHVGLLVIDEFQNISLAQSGGHEELLAFILNLRDQLGVPIVLVGTYKSADMLSNSLAVGRRLVDGGFHNLKRSENADDALWRDFCKTTWEFQWVKKPAKLSDEIIEFLYKCSQGIPGLMLSLFIGAQIEAINSGKETVNMAILRSTFDEQLRPLHSAIDAIRSGDAGKLNYFDDLFLRAFPKIDIEAVPDNNFHDARKRQESAQEASEAATGSGNGGGRKPSARGSEKAAPVAEPEGAKSGGLRKKKQTAGNMREEIQKRSAGISI